MPCERPAGPISNLIPTISQCQQVAYESLESFKKREKLFEKRKPKAYKTQHKPLAIIDIIKKSEVQMMPVHICFKDVARLRVVVVGLGQGQPYPNVTQVFM